jgi:hypothetical protein
MTNTSDEYRDWPFPWKPDADGTGKAQRRHAAYTRVFVVYPHGVTYAEIGNREPDDDRDYVHCAPEGTDDSEMMNLAHTLLRELGTR